MKTSLGNKRKWLTVMLAAGSVGWVNAAEPESALTYNIGVVNNYLYRGISQTRGDAAVQGGVDYADKSGFYVGAWASSIKWIEDNSTATARTSGPTELDIYGGYKFDLSPGTTLDLGYLRYEYLNNNLQNNPSYSNASTDEVYVGMSTPLFNVKFSYALSNLFGQASTPTAGLNAKGATYTEFSREFDLGSGFKLTPKAGMTSMNSNVKDANGGSTSYNDYSLTLSKELQEGLVLSVGYSGTNANKNYYVSGNNGKYLGDQAAVVGLKYNF